jgi:hypothetical protein
MKKLLPMAVTLPLFLIVVGCNQSQTLPSKSSAPTSTPDNLAYEEFRNTPDILEWKAPEEVKTYIFNQLKLGKKIHEIATPRKLSIPAKIYPAQFVKFFQIDELQFAVAQALTGLTLGSWTDETTFVSGIWYADKNDTAWKPFIALTHPKFEGTHNNIFDFWNQKESLYIAVVDSYGAGSGEGTGKVLASGPGGEKWTATQCFDFELGQFLNLQKKSKASFHDTLPAWLTYRKTNENNVEYRYNSSTQHFEGFQFGDFAVGEGECNNIIFP